MGTAATIGWDTVVAFITAAAAAAAVAELWWRSVAFRFLIAFRLLAGVSISIIIIAGSIGGGPDGLGLGLGLGLSRETRNGLPLGLWHISLGRHVPALAPRSMAIDRNKWGACTKSMHKSIIYL